jgi:cobalt-zinc-cadmium efflux system outer membrane protein
MRVACAALALSGVVSLCPSDARGQRVLTLADVLRTARERAPEIISARLALDEAQGRLMGASVRFASNPDLDVSVGPRRGDTRSTDVELGVTQMLEPPGRRAARIAGATAQLDRGKAAVELRTLEVLRDAATAFYRALFAAERVRLLTASEDIARAIFQAADRRYRAGDIAILDVNLSRAALARVRAAREAAAADRESVLGALRGVLGIEGAVDVTGSLTMDAPPDAAALVDAVDRRPEILTLRAGIREAEADVLLAKTLTKPDYGVGVRYQREGPDTVVLGGLTVTLPVLSKGRDGTAVATARAVRLRAELDAARLRARIELTTALAIYQRRLTAVHVMESEALPGLDENDVLTTRSFDVGQIGLADVLLIRRETLDIRTEYLTARLEAALARVTVDAAAAVWR